MFNFTLNENEADDIISSWHNKEKTSFVYAFEIGYDDDLEYTYSMIVDFEYDPSQINGFEIIFYFCEIDSDGKEVYKWMSGKDTKSKICSKAERELVLKYICVCVRSFIDTVGPRLVCIVPYDADLPKKALLKYEIIATMFRPRGYRVGEADPYHGKHIWMMERNGIVDVTS